MDKKTIELLRKAGGGRSYYANTVRQVGNRIEVHFVGDHELTIIEQEAKSPAEAAGEPSMPAKTVILNDQNVGYLRKMAVGLGIKPGKKKKADLISEIMRAMDVSK